MGSPCSHQFLREATELVVHDAPCPATRSRYLRDRPKEGPCPADIRPKTQPKDPASRGRAVQRLPNLKYALLSHIKEEAGFSGPREAKSSLEERGKPLRRGIENRSFLLYPNLDLGSTKMPYEVRKRPEDQARG